MKKTLFAGVLLTSFVCSAQPARTFESTINSWLYPNLSTEVFDGRGVVIAGTTERDPVTGFQVPMFKLTDFNLNPPPGGFNPSYYTRFGVSEDRRLMDFTTDQNSLRISMVTIGPNNLMAGATNLYITVINGPSGVPIEHVNVTPTSSVPATYIPHQIIYSSTQNQYAIVGTKITGTLTTANFATVPKTGFLLIVNAASPMTTVRFIETNTPGGTAGTDYDMLESVTEMPGIGYFAGGSSNGIPTPNEQNLMVMTANYGGAPMASCVVNSTAGNAVSASVMRLTSSSTNEVLVLSNNRDFRTYELLKFTPGATPIFPSVRHLIGGLSSTSVVNGFRLQQDVNGGRIMVGGYIWDNASTAAQLTPFQTTTTPALTAFVNAKTFQSGNNAPLTGYFNESGFPVFINTPDILSYRGTSNQTYLVNPNSNMGGFDMLRSIPSGTLACETNRQFTPVSTQWPFTMNAVSFQQSIPPLNQLSATFLDRLWNNTVMCASTPLAPIDDSEPTLEMASQVKLFPNPAKDRLEIEAETAITEIIVYDLKGNKVLAATNTDNGLGIRLIDISMLQPGVYLLSLKDSDGLLQRQQFVKE